MNSDSAPILTVLFDADGVIQKPLGNWLEGWAALIPDPSMAEVFLADIYTAETAYLAGRKAGFEAAIAAVLQRWNSTASLDDALAMWTHIEPFQENLDLVARVRAKGTGVVLATNQHAFRLRYMAEHLGYQHIFDHLFASCDLGFAKPDANYFQAIARHLNQSPDQLLFIDDHPGNVEGARNAGLKAVHYHLDKGTAALQGLLSRHGIQI